MGEHRFLLVDSSVLPDVFLKVLQAKELLASGSVNNISTAARQAGISRSAFYKYKDYVFDAETGRETITVIATLLDKTGALQSLLTGISAAGASIVTITQSRPENGTAQVEVTVRTGTMQMTVEEMLGRLARQGGVNGLIDLLDGAFRHLGHAQCLFRILLQQPGDLLLGQRVRGK